MPHSKDFEYTLEQAKVCEEAADILDRGFEAVRVKLVQAGLRGDIEFSRCTKCSCEYFVDRGPGDTPPAPPEIPGIGMRCWRVGCTHSRRDHLAFK